MDRVSGQIADWAPFISAPTRSPSAARALFGSGIASKDSISTTHSYCVFHIEKGRELPAGLFAVEQHDYCVAERALLSLKKNRPTRSELWRFFE